MGPLREILVPSIVGKSLKLGASSKGRLKFINIGLEGILIHHFNFTGF